MAHSDLEALREPHTALLRAALELASPAGAGVTLDLACGSGGTTAWLVSRRQPGALIVGLDCDAAALYATRTTAPAASLVRADAHRLPLRAATVDLVWCVAALGLFADPAAALAEVQRVMRPDGVLVVASATQRWVRLRHWPGALQNLSSILSLPPADDLGADLGAALSQAGLREVNLRAYLLEPPGLDPIAAMLPLLSWSALAPLAAGLGPAEQAACAAIAAEEPEPEPLPVLLVAAGRGGDGRTAVTLQDVRDRGVGGGETSLHNPPSPPAAARQTGATPAAGALRAGNNRCVEGRRLATPPCREATA